MKNSISGLPAGECNGPRMLGWGIILAFSVKGVITTSLIVLAWYSLV